MPEQPTIRSLGALRGVVGEGPFWDETTGTLLWVDIPPGLIHRTDPVTSATTTIEVGVDVGAVVPRRDGLVAATALGFATVTDGRYQPRHSFLSEGMRMNDAKCDAQGRFWAGSTARDFTDGAGQLWVLDRDWSVHRVLEDLALPNGMGWSPDGATFYLVDSMRRQLWSFDAVGTDGPLQLAGRRLLYEFSPPGVPDGLCVDRDGCLWVAVWGGSQVLRLSPAGELLDRLPVPVVQPSSCAFGGPDWDVLYVTSAVEGLTDPGPADGMPLEIRGTGARGTPAHRFGG